MPRVLTRYIDEPRIKFLGTGRNKVGASRTDGVLRFEVYACANCETHLSTDGRVMCKDFHTSHGRGYLIKDVINVTNGPSDRRTLMTGVHTCEDVFCVGCNVMVGWEYKHAFEKKEKYKVGNFVLEEVKIVKYHWGS